MQALGYYAAHQINDFAIKAIEVPAPLMQENDLLVRVKAISINPVDYKIRKNRSAAENHPVILGWDAAGIVEKVGKNCKSFKVGDEIFYAGELYRDGCNAALQAVDYRIVAKKPANLSFAQAAALPLTALTAYEAFFPRMITQKDLNTKVLIIGGAGGVGSIATQILKAMTKSFVIVTASRPETVDWCKKMGADLVLDHTQDLKLQLEENHIPYVDAIFSTTHSEKYIAVFPEILRSFGHLCVIDDPDVFNIVNYKSKALSVHWEFMFAKTCHQYEVSSQGEILREISLLVENKKIVSTANTYLKGFSAKNIQIAHALLEAGKSIGKIVIEF